MFFIPILLISWLTIVYFTYRMILRDELNSRKSLENDPALSPHHWNPYIRMF
jgi:hypothetical protein